MSLSRSTTARRRQTPTLRAASALAIVQTGRPGSAAEPESTVQDSLDRSDGELDGEGKLAWDRRER
jgi:hypothetical protein